jgi:hypothetical protein
MPRLYVSSNLSSSLNVRGYKSNFVCTFQVIILDRSVCSFTLNFSMASFLYKASFISHHTLVCCKAESCLCPSSPHCPLLGLFSCPLDCKAVLTQAILLCLPNLLIQALLPQLQGFLPSWPPLEPFLPLTETVSLPWSTLGPRTDLG